MTCGRFRYQSVLFGIFVAFIDRTYSQTSLPTCEVSSCYPDVGNLLIGREKQLYASSTCGQQKEEHFCVVSHLKEKKKCFVCDARNLGKSHEIENVVSRIGGNNSKWWQAENGKENVTIQLDLEMEFHFTHLIIVFKTFRPAAMLLEKSHDFGTTWKVYNYFAYNCTKSFPGISTESRQKVTDVVCDSQYSEVEPSTMGEVIFKVIPPNIQVDDPYSLEVQDTLKVTNLRLNLTKLHTLGDNLLDSAKPNKMKYYYAIYEIVARGRCFCNGHAGNCVPQLGQHTGPDIVYGKCLCTHHTKGLNCEECEDMYNDVPWKPAIGNHTNACGKCNCNGHATRCHFDWAVWNSTNKVSGGMCDGCQHNTMGRNCEQCKPFFYHDPTLDVTHVNVCQPCDCDRHGSLDKGNCESVSDPAAGIVAGFCRCKTNVEGRRCDHCKTRFWNFQPDNPDGCESCRCNISGIIGNPDCNEMTGKCSCKKNVVGRDCSQCSPEFWGFSSDELGCKPCDCNPGGAYDNNCDVINGQCRCQPHVSGRRCDQPVSRYFVGNLDYLTYEAELTTSCQNCAVNIREPESGKEQTWTGLGFMMVYEGSSLRFNITNVPQTLEYGIVIRYEQQLPLDWEMAVVYIEKTSNIDDMGPCAKIPLFDEKLLSLSSRERYTLIYPPVCLEKGEKYQVHLELTYYNMQEDRPRAFIFIDSIVLLPVVDRIPFHHKNDLVKQNYEEFKSFQCDKIFLAVLQRDPHEACKNFLYSIGFFVFGSIKCDCSVTGSMSEECDILGGQCQCKPNTAGRQCDRCVPGTYDFSQRGCRACNCHTDGSLDNICDTETGQCHCYGNISGQQCNECLSGFWNYPDCEVCECNGHADSCNSETGSCLNCSDFTTGVRCDRCVTGYFGNPRIGINISCQPCLCPGPRDSGFSHAQDCELDSQSNNSICHCEEGYKGEKCESCADNFFGNLTVTGGKCQRCDCNDNINTTIPGSCDQLTGECLLCIFNTEGSNCEYCKEGFYGNATQQDCQVCMCNSLGTDHTSEHCNSTTGQCVCLPNVIGQTCDQCDINYWDFGSDEGCKPCNCDPQGLMSDYCNVFDGQCHCKEGYGGRTCSNCEERYWADQEMGCISCECDSEGSVTLECGSDGTCFCKERVIGKQCNQCARGYIGRVPNCKNCGECFQQWDCKIQDLKNDTVVLIEEFKETNDTVTKVVNTRVFENMTEKLQEMQQILDGENVTELDTEEMETFLELMQNLTSQLEDMELEVEVTVQRICDTNVTLMDEREQASVLEQNVKYMESNITKLHKMDVEGTFNVIVRVGEKSDLAENRMNAAQDVLNESALRGNRTEVLIEQENVVLDNTYAENKSALKNVSDKASDILEAGISYINTLVCDGTGTVDDCDYLCGGIGCDKCGGNGCDNGAITLAKNALDLVKEAQYNINWKETAVKGLLYELGNLNGFSETLKVAREAYELAKNARFQTEDTPEVEGLLIHIENLFNSDRAQLTGTRAILEEVKLASSECLNVKMSLDPEKTEELADEINWMGENLSNIDVTFISKPNDSKGSELLRRALKAKNTTDTILEVAKAKVLDEANDLQESVATFITVDRGYISTTENVLAEIEDQTQEVKALSVNLEKIVEILTEKSDELHKRYLTNEYFLNKATEEVEHVPELAGKAENDAQLLEEEFNTAENLLIQKELALNEKRNLKENLKKKAIELADFATRNYHELSSLESELKRNNEALNNYQDVIHRLQQESEDDLAVIRKKNRLYRTCT